MQRRFLPSRDGFAFVNSWPSQPAVVRPTPLGTLTLGDAAAGLCGGMVFAALDYWQSGTPPPSQRPEAGHPLYGFIVHRLVDSWSLPVGVAQYYQWMKLPDSDATFTLLGRPIRGRRGLAWRTVTQQWPQVSRDLDRGAPVPLGVVTVASTDPRNLAHNHQVLACDYEATNGRATIQVYDPNRGRRDDIFISFDTGTPTGPTAFAHNLGIGERPIRGFFQTTYRAARIPGA
ncbi:MAG TPA: hypothetical protein VFM55_01385 [Micromonosporaceae bacterium]|nr:hypothetical protein [Micromonosporaceae bacterium]